MLAIPNLLGRVEKLEEENRLQRMEINRIIHKDDPQPECDVWTVL